MSGPLKFNLLQIKHGTLWEFVYGEVEKLQPAKKGRH